MKKFIFLLAMLMLSFCMVSFIFMEVAAEKEQDVIVLRAAHQGAPGGFTDVTACKFKDLVETKSQGKVEVQIYPSGQLGTVREILESLEMGTVDILFEGLSWLAQYEKDFNFFNQSFMYTDPQELIDSPYQRELIEKVRKNHSIRVLDYSAVMPAMQLWTKTKPVYNLGDLEGIRIRVPAVKAYIDMWNILGANAISVEWSEVYLALSQNLIGGIVHNPVKIRDEHFYEHLKYCTILDFKYSLSPVYISDKTYESFSPDIQRILQESAEEYSIFFNTETKNTEKEAWDEMKKAGIEIIEVDRDPWFKRGNQIHIQMEEDGTWSDGLIAKEKNI